MKWCPNNPVKNSPFIFIKLRILLITSETISDSYRSFSLSRNPDTIKNLFENHLADKIKKLWCYRRLIKMTLLEFLSLCVFPSSDIRRNILHKFTETRMEPPCWCTSAVLPTLRPEKIVNIWNLLWLSRWLIIWTEPTNIHTSTFPNTLTPKKAKNH